jgi:hypothetical protein
VFIVCYGYANTTAVFRFADVFGRFRTVTKSVGYLYGVSLSAWNNSAPTGRIFIKFYIGDFIKISRANLHVSLVKTGQTYGALYVMTEVCNKTFYVVDSDVCRTHCCVSMTTFLILSLVSRQIFKIALPYDRVKDRQNPIIPHCYVIRTIPILSVFLIYFSP